MVEMGTEEWRRRSIKGDALAWNAWNNSSASSRQNLPYLHIALSPIIPFPPAILSSQAECAITATTPSQYSNRNKISILPHADFRAQMRKNPTKPVISHLTSHVSRAQTPLSPIIPFPPAISSSQAECAKTATTQSRYSNRNKISILPHAGFRAKMRKNPTKPVFSPLTFHVSRTQSPLSPIIPCPPAISSSRAECAKTATTPGRCSNPNKISHLSHACFRAKMRKNPTKPVISHLTSHELNRPSGRTESPSRKRPHIGTGISTIPG